MFKTAACHIQSDALAISSAKIDDSPDDCTGSAIAGMYNVCYNFHLIVACGLDCGIIEISQNLRVEDLL